MKTKESIKDILADIRNFMLSKKNVLSMKELETYTGFSSSYIYKLTMSRLIPFYKKPGGKIIFFKRTEIDEWLTSTPCLTRDRLIGRGEGNVTQKGHALRKIIR